MEKGQKKATGKGIGEDSAIPPLNVLDLPPPPPNETVGDAFENAYGGLEEGKLDKRTNPCGDQDPC